MNYPCGHPRTEENTYRKPTRSRNGIYYECVYCKTCDRERTKRYRERNPDYNAKYLREWRRGMRRLRGCRLERAWKPLFASSPRNG